MKLTDQLRQQWGTLGFDRRLNDKQPSPIVVAQAACADIITNRQRFPMLGNGKGQRRLLFTTQNRERRIERVRMHARILSVLFGSADLLTLSNGVRDKNGVCHPLTERQIGERLELDDNIEAATDAKLDHDTRGMRAMRAALRDIDDGGLVTRHQPKVQYCSAPAGGCGKKVPRGGTCDCGRRWLWRWRSLPTIITITRFCLEKLGVLELFVEAQEVRIDEMRAGGVTPILDIKRRRMEQRIVRQQAIAAKRAGLPPPVHDARRAADEAEQLRRIFGTGPPKKQE